MSILITVARIIFLNIKYDEANQEIKYFGIMTMRLYENHTFYMVIALDPEKKRSAATARKKRCKSLR
jgi:hypothetical protein